MPGRYQRRFLCLLIALGATVAPEMHAPVYAQPSDNNDFFGKNAASNILVDPVRELDAAPIAYFNEKRKLELAPEEAPQAQGTPKPEVDPKKTKFESVDQLKQAFGDGSDDPPVLPQGDAPRPFVAMMQALELGDDDLAFEYAKQYVRYRDRQKRVVDKLMAMQGMAQEREGFTDEEGWHRAPEFEQYRDILQRDIEEEEAKKKASQAEIEGQVMGEKTVLLPPDPLAGASRSGGEGEPNPHDLFTRASALTARAARETKGASRSTGTPEPESTLSPEQERRRVQLQASLRGRVPVDPKGQVDVFFFFKPNDKASRAMAAVVDNLYKRFIRDDRVTVIGLAVDSTNPSRLTVFQDSANVAYPVQPGSELAKQAKITEVPAVLIRSPNTQAGLLERGQKDVDYLEAVVRSMQGVEG